MSKLLLGDCLEVLRTMPDCSVDAVVTDPPYGLAFMGKRWDYDVPSVEIWAECLRVLKPGGHLLAFAGTRTQHRMAVRIEDAGFEIRDMIAWVYGSGFPKSLDVSKAIDKQRTEDLQPAADVARWLVQQIEARGISRRDICDHFQAENIAQQWTTHWTDGAVKPRVPKWDQWLELRLWLGLPDDMDAEVWRLNGRKGKPGDNFAERKVVGQGSSAISTRKDLRNGKGTVWGADSSTFDITAPATPEAQQWAGWGTALKPALEPITMARKPLTGTVAANVLEHGTGALNVDGCRVGTDGGTTRSEQAPYAESGWRTGRKIETLNAGRWPANLIHDGSDEVAGLFPANAGAFAPVRGTEPSKPAKNTYGEYARGEGAFHNDTGSAARFFYTAKASKNERQGVAHPTVKPIELMAYLCRLVTPAGGTVLDPFMGSGTTIKAALSEGFNAIGIERDPAYFEMAQHRMDGAQMGLSL